MPEPTERNVADLKLYPSARNSADWAEVEPAVRNAGFFSACVEDARILEGLQRLVAQAIDNGLSNGEFVRQALVMLDEFSLTPPEDASKREAFDISMGELSNPERLRLIFRTQMALADGYREFCKAFDPDRLRLRPGWEFVRQPGAKTKREDHVNHEGAIRLKTDIQFWLDRNSPDFGGFGNPYPPFGFNSWMRVFDVSRKECEKLGLLKPGEDVKIPAELAEWNLPTVLKQMATASTENLTEESILQINEDCADMGFALESPEPGLLQIATDEEWDDPMSELESAFFEDWLEDLLFAEEDLMQINPNVRFDFTPQPK